MHPLLTTLTLLACLLSFTSSTHAQTPSPDDTLRAFRIAEKHIRDWTLPTDAAANTTQNTDAPKAVGACITLKLRGEVIARGTAWSGAIAGPEAFSNDVLRHAILAAMQQADPKLGVPNDAMRDATIKLVTPDILISVELAGPLSVVEFNTWDDAEISLRPGLDGVAARQRASRVSERSTDNSTGVGPLHAIFPSQMMLGNMLPHRAMGAVAAKVIGEGGAAAALDDPKKLREANGVRMYRFRVGQVVQGGFGGGPNVLYRGASLGQGGVVATSIELRVVARALADHLVSAVQSAPDIRITGGDAGMDRERPSDFDMTIRAMCIWSLNEYLSTNPQDVVHAKRVQCFIESWSCTQRDAPRMVPLGDRTREGIRALWLGLVRNRVACNAPIASPHGNRVTMDVDYLQQYEQPSILPALESWWNTVVIGAPEVSAEAKEHHRREQNRIFEDERERGVVAQMPWLGWAARNMATGGNDIPSALALRQMRSDCWKHQLSITDTTEDTLDMAGGIVFTKGLADGRAGNPYPTWQCVRPLAFIATMLRDPRLTEPQERTDQIVRLMQAARFLRQLQVDEASAWMYPDPTLAIGGIRASTWDNALPVDATSMTLLFVVELIKSLDELSAAKHAPAAPTTPK